MRLRLFQALIETERDCYSWFDEEASSIDKVLLKFRKIAGKRRIVKIEEEEDD
jgi:hypothetical protein